MVRRFEGGGVSIMNGAWPIYFYNPETDMVTKLLESFEIVKKENLIGTLWGIEFYKSKLVPIDEIWIMKNKTITERIKLA